MVNVETARETEPPTLQETKHDDAEKEERNFQRKEPESYYLIYGLMHRRWLAK